MPGQDAAAPEVEIEVSQDDRPTIENPDGLVDIWNSELRQSTVVPRHAYEVLWKGRGWVEYDPADLDHVPWSEATAHAPESNELGTEDSDAVPPPDLESKDGTPAPGAALGGKKKE